MTSTLSIKCIPYINGSKRNAIRGVYCLTRRFKSDDDNSSKKNQLAVDKLNDLLKTMKKGNDIEMLPQQSKPIKLTKPRQLAREAEQKKQETNDSKQNKPLGEKLSDAATKVAQSIGGDTNKTKSDLLNLLKIYNNEPDNSAEKKVKSSVQLDDLLSGMKIDRTQSKKSLEFSDIDRAQRVRQLLGHSSGDGDHKRTKKYRNPMDNYMPINLFSSEPLGIFKNIHINKDIPTLPTWDRLHEKSLQTAVTHPPKNIYEQMIIWTEQGKLWTFPINNEQGMDDESNVFFAEHVFLEPLIDEWCPKKGPIRHFMELVCVGLSKNPFLSVEEKKDHINWFRQYFYEKNQLLSEVGAFEIKSLPENVKEYYKPSIPDE